MSAEEKLSIAETELYDLMSEISEDCWCAEWLGGNEYSLWAALHDGELKYGQGHIDRVLLAKVASLSVQTGTWIIWRDDDSIPLDEHGPYAIPLHEWSVMYDSKQARSAIPHPPGEAAERTVKPHLYGDPERARVCRDAAATVSRSFCTDGGKPLAVYAPPKLDHDWGDPVQTGRDQQAGGQRDLKSLETRMNASLGGGGQVASEGVSTLPSTPLPCPNTAHMGEHACTNRHQCFEPCGELGHSAEHAKPAGAPVDERAASFAHIMQLADTYAEGKHSNGRFNEQRKALVDAVFAALQQPGQAVPDGWKLVPDDQNMTDDQAEAIAKMANCCGGIAYDIYRVALAAAPVFGTVPGEAG